MDSIIVWLEHYGLAAVFANILLEQLGLPLPAYPVLILTGALSQGGRYSPGALLATAVLACLIADTVFYWTGRLYGGRVLKALCRVSLSPDSCVRQTESIYSRWGIRSLALAKFIPGFATLATALAGKTGVPYGRFLFYDTIGATVYAGLGIGIGMVFHDAVQDILDVLAQLGRIGLSALAAGFAVFLAYRYWQRQRFFRQLRMARVTPQQLQHMLEAAPTPLVLDVRSALSRDGGAVIPGARLWSDLEQRFDTLGLAPGAVVVVYCSCPNEASAAKVAKRLMAAGFDNVRPLHGGIEAWVKAGFAVEQR